MLKKILLTCVIIFSECSGITIRKAEHLEVHNTFEYDVYNSPDFSLKIHVITMPLATTKISLELAQGQREEVSTIAQRVGALIAINGSNYRRGGKYNGNRLNLCIKDQNIYANITGAHGTFCWNNANTQAIIDMLSLNTDFAVANTNYPIDAINQPRIPGQAVLYNDKADTALLRHTSGRNIIVNADMIVTEVTSTPPSHIPSGWHVYQQDALQASLITPGNLMELRHRLQSIYKQQDVVPCDFALGGAGLLVQNGKDVTDQLTHEYSQGSTVVHCHDEVAADFHTETMQNWLIKLRHPRTALGITKNNAICVVVVDGRQELSEGLTLPELAQFMQSLDCVNALNIGGGGCTTLYVRDKVVNIPSTSGEERPVAEALCFYPRAVS